MAIELIKPSGLPAADNVSETDVIPVDNGAIVAKATPKQIVDAARPIASESQAISGVNNETAMTPLTTRQAIAADQDGVLAGAIDASNLAQAWAESATSPDGEPDSKSSKTWAEAAAVSADNAAANSLVATKPYANRAEASTSFPGGATTLRVMTPSGQILTYFNDPAGPTPAPLTTPGGRKWYPVGDVYPDHWAENTSPGTTDMRAAILSAIEHGKAELLPTTYAVLGAVVVVGNDKSLHMPTGSKIVPLDNSNNPIDVDGERFYIYGDGEIDCKSITSGIQAGPSGLGLRVHGIKIKNPTERGIQCANNFSPTEFIEIHDVRVYWDAAGVAAMPVSALPLVINVFGDSTQRVENVSIQRCVVDMSQWSVERLAMVRYPTTGGTGSTSAIGVRITQRWDDIVQESVKVEGCTVLMPVAESYDEWDPVFYGNTADTAGQRRPTNYEISGTTPSGVKQMVFSGNTGVGGDLGASLGSIDRVLYNNNKMLYQTHYCAELGNGDEVTGAGNLFDGRYAYKVISAAHMRVLNLPGSYVIGPKHDGSIFSTAISTEGLVEIVNMTGSIFTAVSAGPLVRLFAEGVDNDVFNFSSCVFAGDGVAGVDAIEVRSTLGCLNLTGAQFHRITGKTLNNLGTIQTLTTIGMNEQDCAGTIAKGSVTRHMDGFNHAANFRGLDLQLSSVALLPSAQSIKLELGNHNFMYSDKSWFSVRGQAFQYNAPTDDGSDTGSFFFGGGGGASEFRGGTIKLYGNEHATLPGQAILEAGTNRNAKVKASGTGDVVLELTGSGKVQFGTHAAKAAETVTGYITIKDAGGTLRKLAVLS